MKSARIYIAVALVILMVLATFAYLYVFVPSKDAAQVGNLLIEGLVNHDSSKVLKATGGCAECAERLETDWAIVISKLGAVRAWRFQRVGVGCEIEAQKPMVTSGYEVEYEMVFDNGRRELVVVIDRSSGRSLAKSIRIRQVFTFP